MQSFLSLAGVCVAALTLTPPAAGALTTLSAANNWTIVETSTNNATISLNLEGSSYQFTDGAPYAANYHPNPVGTLWYLRETSHITQPILVDPSTNRTLDHYGWVAWAEPDSDLYNAVFLIPSGNEGLTDFYALSDVSIAELNSAPGFRSYDTRCYHYVGPDFTFPSCPILSNGDTVVLPLNINFGENTSIAITFTDLGDTAPEPGGTLLFTTGLVWLAGLRPARRTSPGSPDFAWPGATANHNIRRKFTRSCFSVSVNPIRKRRL